MHSILVKRGSESVTHIKKDVLRTLGFKVKDLV